MKYSFREHHLFQILCRYEKQNIPLDLFLSGYFRANKAVGSKDRKYIADTVYNMVRWRGLLDHFSSKPPSWEKRHALLKEINLKEYAKDESIPPHIRVSFPKTFFQALCEALEYDEAIRLCLISNTQAPTTIRVNTLKISREELLEKWKDSYLVSPCLSSKNGIIFHKKINFFALPEFKLGLFEVQDEGSQLVASLVDAQPGDLVLDYCAGSGGKTLAFAPNMQNKGQIYLHDIRSHALDEAKKRLNRAGIQNAQCMQSSDSKKGLLKGKMDWVLVDAPCTGSGTLRRNPDMKWKFEPEMIARLVQEQQEIFEKALEFLHPSGRIVYATCSLFPQENEQQVEWFQKTFNLKPVQEPFRSLPSDGGMDGFYGAVLSYKK